MGVGGRGHERPTVEVGGHEAEGRQESWGVNGQVGRRPSSERRRNVDVLGRSGEEIVGEGRSNSKVTI